MGNVSNARLAGLLLACAALLFGCRSRDAAEIPQGSYYTRYTLHVEKDVHRTTNYRRGFVLPINTEVAVLSSGRNRIVVQVQPDGRKLTIENIPRHTGGTLEDAFAQVLSPDPIDVSEFAPEQQEAILEGKALVGMDKKAVLAAMGPPPLTGTASLESSEWKYWDSRFTTFFVRFDEDGRVVDARARR